MRKLALALFLVACGAPESEPVAVDPIEAADAKADGLSSRVPEVGCNDTPNAGAHGSWRHWKSALAALGSPKHRGIDLVVSANAGTQTLTGDLSYGLTDKALEDEQVDLFACRSYQWIQVGSAISDGEGHFRLSLTGAARFPVGLRDLYLSVRGDRTGTRFAALVAPPGTALVVSDIDGTLTSSESAFPESLVTGRQVGVQSDAAEFFQRLRGRGYFPVFVSARGRVFTRATRDWLGAQGFPRGLLRLAPSIAVLPGSATVSYKAGALNDLAANGFDVAVGVGNRATDAEAYQRVGVDAESLFLLDGEYPSEVEPLVADGEAVGFESFGEIVPVAQSFPMR